MTNFFTRVILTAIAALVASYVISGVYIDGIFTAIVVALVLALLNTFIKPVLVIFTIPITILTLGLFLIIINILIIELAAALVDGFAVRNWWAALLFSFIVSIVSSILEKLVGKKK